MRPSGNSSASCRQHRLLRDEKLLLYGGFGCRRLRLFTFGLKPPERDRTSCATTINRPGESPGLVFFVEGIDGLVIHPAHAATGHCRRCGLLLRHFGHHGFRGDQQAGDRNRAL